MPPVCVDAARRICDEYQILVSELWTYSTTFDQVRFIVSGQVKYGPLRISGGDVAYFPEGVFYGPTEPISEEVTTCTIQTQGPTWGAFPNDAECAAVAERMTGRIGFVGSNPVTERMIVLRPASILYGP